MIECKMMPHRGLQLTSYEVMPDRLVIHTLRQSDEEDQHGRVELLPLRDRIIRVRYSERDFVERKSESLVSVAPDTSWHASETETAVLLHTPSVTVEVQRGTCALTYRTARGELICAEPEEGGKRLEPIDVERTEWGEGSHLVDDDTLEQVDAPVEVRIYPGADATFLFYEDAGDGYTYEQGAASILVGDAANESMRTGRVVRISERCSLRPDATRLSELT